MLNENVLENLLCYKLFVDPDEFPFSLIFKRTERIWLEKCCGNHAIFLTDAYLPKLFEFIRCYGDNSTTIIEVSRTLARLLNILRENEIILNKKEEKKTLEFVFHYFDNIIDIVCYNCINIFNCLLYLHRLRCAKFKQQEKCHSLRRIRESLLDFSLPSRGRFKCLLLFMRHFGGIFGKFPEEIVQKFYGLISSPSVVNTVCELIAFDLSSNLGDISRCDLHVKLLKSVLLSTCFEIRNGAFQKLIPALQRDNQLIHWILHEFAPSLSGCEKPDETLLKAQLLLAKLCVKNQRFVGKYLSWNSFISRNTVIYALMHSKLELRLGAWNLITDHPKPTFKIAIDEVDLFKAFLASNFCEQSPAARQIILTGLKKLLVRIREITNSSVKSCTKLGEFECYAGFIEWLSRICFDSLQPGAKFNRRLLALQFISCIFKEPFLWIPGKEMFFQTILPRISPNSSMISCLINCLNDSFELCQDIAFDLLTSCDFVTDINLVDFLEDTKKLLFSIRFVNTLVCGYRLRYFVYKVPSEFCGIFDFLLEITQVRLKLSKNDLVNIVTKEGQLHPILNAISVLINCEKWEDMSYERYQWWSTRLFDKLMPICIEISNLLAPVVHCLSPEGFIPCGSNSIFDYDSDDFINSQNNGCQILLVNCWRAHKHISKIFQSLVAKLPIPSFLTFEILHGIRDYFWSQLTECKHFGVIESAVNGFESLCKRMWVIEESKLNGNSIIEPEKWLFNILKIIRDNEACENLCLTRRSAGLPHLICSILRTEPSKRNSKSLEVALDFLLNIHNLPTDSKIHCINILRIIFLDCRLSKKMVDRAERSLALCIILFDSPQWSVRNSISQLFAVLIIRIFGVNRFAQQFYIHPKNRFSSLEFFNRYPSLFDIIHSQLLNSCGARFSVFALLTILSYLNPSNADNNPFPLSAFIFPTLNIMLKCKCEKLRQLGAAVLHSILTLEDMRMILNWIVSIDYSHICQNQVHSILLMLNLLIGCLTSISIQARSHIYCIISKNLSENWCNYNKAILADLSSQCKFNLDVTHLKLFLSGSAPSIFRPLGSLVARTLTGNSNTTEAYELKSLVLNNPYLRFELWRSISKHYEQIYLDEDYIEKAISDLSDANEDVLLHILNILVRIASGEFGEGDADLRGKLNSFYCWLSGKLFRRKTIQDLAYLLNIIISSTFSDYDWLVDSAGSESFESRLIAVRAITWLTKKENIDMNEVLRSSMILLQDEEQKIREMVAICISEFLGYSPLNSQIIIWIIAKSFPALAVQMDDATAVGEVQEERLFDACCSNSYAEKCLIGIDLLDDILVLL